MEVATERIGDVAIVRTKDRFYSSAASGAEKSFATALVGGISLLVIDMPELDYIGSGGLRVLLRLAKRAERANGKLALFGLQPNVSEVFSITALDKIFSIHGGEGAAVAMVR